MGQSQSSQTPQAIPKEPSNAPEVSLDSEAAAPTTAEKSKRRLFKRRSQASVSTLAQPRAVPSGSHDAPVPSSSKPAHKRSDSEATIIGSTSDSVKRKRWSLGGRSSSNASTHTICAKPEDSTEAAYPRALMRRLTSGRKSRYPSEQLPTTSDQPEEEEAAQEDNDRTPGSEVSDPLADDRRRAQEMIAAALQANASTVATVTDSRIGRVAAVEDSRVRMTNEEDELEPPLEIIPIADESNQAPPTLIQTPPSTTSQLPEAIPLPSPRSAHSSSATITPSPSDVPQSLPTTLQPESQSSAQSTPSSPSASQTRPTASRRILVQGTIQTIVASENPDSSDSPASTFNEESDCFTLENTFMSSDTPLTLSSDSPPMPDFGTAASQAIVISRLLSVAAAATAGSLLPGAIRLGGQEVTGFAGLSGNSETPVGIPVNSPPTSENTSTSPSSTPPAEERQSRRRSWFSPFSSSSPAEERGSALDAAMASQSRNSATTPPAEERSSRRESWLSPFSSSPSNTSSNSPTEERRNPIRRLLSRNSTNNTTPTPRNPATAVILSREQFINSPSPNPEAPEGSFERFLADLTSDVGIALLRTSVEGMAMNQSQANQAGSEQEESSQEDESEDQRNSETPPQADQNAEQDPHTLAPRFAFFRSYQFANRLMSPSGELSDLPDDGSLGREAGQAPDENESASESQPEERSSEEDDTVTEEQYIQSIADQPARSSLPSRTTSDQPDPPSSTSQASSPSAQNQGNPSNESSNSAADTPAGTIVTPLLFVGVRRIHLSSSNATPESQDASIPSDQPSDPVANEDEGIPMNDLFGTNTEGEEGFAIRSGNSPEDPAETARIMRTGRSEHFLLWIAGGIYPRDHPILTLPALLAAIDSNASYEELLRLGELMGTAKSNTASQEDVAKSELKVVEAKEVDTLKELGLILANSAEKCRVCLEDYEPDEKVRLMECKHAFHRDCIDKWLTTGRNECPMCRSKGVEKTSEPEEAPQVATVEM